MHVLQRWYAALHILPCTQEQKQHPPPFPSTAATLCILPLILCRSSHVYYPPRIRPHLTLPPQALDLSLLSLRSINQRKPSDVEAATTAKMTGDCTTCPFAQGFLPYSPSTPGNAFLLAAFAALVPATLFLGYRARALGFTLSFVTALCLEVLGFVGRLLLGRSLRSTAFFALYLFGSVLGELALASATFVVLPHVLGLYGGAGARAAARVAVGLGGLTVVIAVLEVVGIVFAVFGIGGAIVSVHGWLYRLGV